MAARHASDAALLGVADDAHERGGDRRGCVVLLVVGLRVGASVSYVRASGVSGAMMYLSTDCVVKGSV